MDKGWILGGKRMKKIVFSMIVVLLFLLGCSSEPKGDAVLKETSLTDFERNLISLYGESAIIHDVKILNDDVKEIYLYIDLYKQGERMGTVSEISSGISEDKFKTIFLNLKPTDEERQWVSAVMLESGYASGNASNKLDDETYESSAWGGITGENELKIGKKQPVGSLVYSNQNQIGMIDDLSTEDAVKQQTNYEEVYIFSIELR